MKKYFFMFKELLTNHKRMLILIWIAAFFSIAAGGILYMLLPILLKYLPLRSFDALVYYRSQLQFLSRVAVYLGIIALICGGISYKTRPSLKLLSLGALLAGAALRLDCYFSRELWNDTLSLAVWLKELSFAEILSGKGANPYCQSAPPVFALLSKLIGDLAGYRSLYLNAMPLLFSLGGLWCFRTLAGKLLTPTGAAAALWLFALNPGTYFYAGEFKQYSGDIFFTIVILNMTVDYVRNSEKFPWSLSVTGIIGTLFSHAMFFILPAVGLAMLLNCRKFPFSHLAGTAALWLPVVLLLALWTKAAMPGDMYVHEHHITGFAPLPTSAENLNWYWKTALDLFIAPWGLSWKFAILSLFPLVGMCNGIRLFFHENKVFINAFLFTMSLLLAASILHQYSMAAGAPFAKSRLILFTIPFAPICFVKGVETGKWRYLLLPAAVCSLLNITTSFMPLADIVPAVRALEKYHTPGSTVYVNSVAAECAVKLYSKSPEKFKKLIRIPFNRIPDEAEGFVVVADVPLKYITVGKNTELLSCRSFALSSLMVVEKKKSH